MTRYIGIACLVVALLAGIISRASAAEPAGEPRVLVPLAEGFNDLEHWGCYAALRAAGFQVDVAGPAKGPLGQGWKAAHVNLTLDEVDVSRYVGLVIPGGSSPERLEKFPKALEICRAFMQAGKPVGAICHGPRLLMKAGLLKDRVATGLWWIADECPEDWMNGLQGKYLDRAPVMDRNLITARHPGDIGVFNQAVIPALAAAAGRKLARAGASVLVVYPEADDEYKWWFTNRDVNLAEGLFGVLGMNLRAVSDAEVAGLASSSAPSRAACDLLALVLKPGPANSLKESAPFRALVESTKQAGKAVGATEEGLRLLKDMGLADGVQALPAAPPDLLCELVAAARTAAGGREPKEEKPKREGRCVRALALEPGFDDALATALRVHLQFGGFSQQETDAAGWLFREVKFVGEKRGWTTGRNGIPLEIGLTTAEAAGLADKTIRLSKDGTVLHPSANSAETAELESLIRAAKTGGVGAGPFGAVIAVQPGFDDEVVAATRLLLAAQDRQVAIVAPAKGEVHGLNGTRLTATHTYEDDVPLTKNALVVAPGAIWPKKELDKSDKQRVAWLLAKRDAGAALIAFGFDSQRLSREPVFKGKKFAASDQNRPSTKLGMGEYSPELALWTDDRLLTARGADCLAEAWRMMPVFVRPERTVDVLGEFLWARAQGKAENALFTDSLGGEPGKRTCLLSSIATAGGVLRNNLASLRPEVAHTLQIKELRLHTSGDSNCKIMLGYMGTDWRFAHGVNADLAHWAGGDRVVLFIPIRHAKAADPANGSVYLVSPYGGQTISVMEFRAGEMIHYEWFAGGPGKLHERVLMDLYPACKDMKPGVTEPIFKFDVQGGGHWKVCIKFDGRKGLPNGGALDTDWDLVVTDQSPGAKPYSVPLPSQNAFHLTVYNPGATSTGSDILLKLDPFDRATGKPLPPFERSLVRKDVPLRDLPGVLSSLTKETRP